MTIKILSSSIFQFDVLCVAAVCLVVGVVTYPAGWDAVEVKKTCGTSAGIYELGECGLRWAYLLAVIGCLDAIILAALAFILATRHVRLQAEPGYAANGSLYKGNIITNCIIKSQSEFFILELINFRGFPNP